MPRGSRDGSIIIVPAVRDPRTRRLLEPEKIYVRKRYKDPLTGRWREKKRLVENRKGVADKRYELVDEIKGDEAKLVQEQRADNKTFGDLVAYFKQHYAKPARYRDGVKIGGYRSIGTVESQLKTLQKLINPDRLLSSITYEYLAEIKEQLLATDVVYTRVKKSKRKGNQTITTTRPRSVTTVHRTMQLLRRMLRIAIRKRPQWLTENPFHAGDPLIQTSGENERMRILTREEETKLLAVCFGARAHLADALTFAIETAMRENEQFETRCEDVDLVAGLIPVYRMAANKKRVFTRWVPINERLRPVLEKLIEEAGGCGPLFPYRNLDRSFATACRLAGLEGFRWNDLRHTGITWMLEATGDPGRVMKVSGHKEWKTFLRYVNLNPEVARRFAQQVDAHRAAVSEAAEVCELS